jgi:N-acetyl-anhydromuramyl-L-alanine amidase AmpD
VEETAGTTTPSTEATQPPTETTAPTQPEPVYVFPGAVEEFLEPLAQFSWEQEKNAEFVMIHFTSAVVIDPQNPYDLGSVRKIFTDYEISVHYLIDRDGTVYCYIPENRVAWHAGVGTWQGDEAYANKMNHYAIGIELMGIGSESDMRPYLSSEQYLQLDPSLLGFTDAQYTSLSALVADICQRNQIPMDKDHIIGHQEYNPQKTDPGDLFQWNRLLPAE